MTLHTPLQVTERYRHSYDVFPDADRKLPFGSGATCAYNYRIRKQDKIKESRHGGVDIKGLFFDGKLQYRDDLPEPVPSPGEALVRVLLSAVCNTDLELIKGYKGFRGIPGHEFVGVVEESANPELTGLRVVGDINLGCRECSFCKKGVPNLCAHRRVLGIQDKNGAFAEYITLPAENLFPVPKEVSNEEAVLAEPLAAALEVTGRVHILPSDCVAVIGDGKLGYLVTQVLALTGCNLTVIGKHASNLERLQDYANTVFLENIDAGSETFDAVVECTGNQQGLKLAGELVKPRGTVVLKSTYAGEANITPSLWVVKEVSLVGSRCGPLESALRLMEKGYVQLLPLLGKRYSLAEYENAFFNRTYNKPVFDPSI